MLICLWCIHRQTKMKVSKNNIEIIKFKGSSMYDQGGQGLLNFQGT